MSSFCTEVMVALPDPRPCACPAAGAMEEALVVLTHHNYLLFKAAISHKTHSSSQKYRRVGLSSESQILSSLGAKPRCSNTVQNGTVVDPRGINQRQLLQKRKDRRSDLQTPM